MKHPRPSPPDNVPPGTTQLGGPIEWFSAALHVTAEDLQPDQVTELLGCQPSRQQVKGVPLLRPDGSTRYTPRFGRWSRVIKSANTDEWDISEVVRLLFDGLPNDQHVWDVIATLGRVRVSLGLSMSKDNQEFEFDPGLLQLLASRSAAVWFDIYGPDSNEA